MTVNINDFERQVDCIYKNEHYSVRDNGAVLRHPRPDKSLRKHDNKWTFGTPNNCGYLLIVSEVVHRIVAYAFLGEPPTPQHIVDHLDTNRQNNRPENLRWLTKLENILNNPITVKKIVLRCGSIEAFLKDPSILKNYQGEDPNFSWMRAVTPEEAQLSWKRLNSWAKKEVNHTTTGIRLGERLFQDNQNSFPVKDASEFVNSETPTAVQKKWKIPCEFPFCPLIINENPIAEYAANLKAGFIFSINKYSRFVIIDLATSKDGSTLWVLSQNWEGDAIKPWSLAQITFENNLFVHTNLGSFFEKVGADKKFTQAQGLEWKGGDTFDDFA